MPGQIWSADGLLFVIFKYIPENYKIKDDIKKEIRFFFFIFI